TGEVRRLARRVKPIGFWLAPDGKHVAFTTWRGLEGAASQQPLFDLVVVDLTDGHSRILAARQPMAYGVSVSWSPDSARLAFTTAGPRAKGDCFVVAASGGEPILWTKGEHRSLAADYAPPLWDAARKSLYCLGDAKVWKIDGAGGATCITKE